MPFYRVCGLTVESHIPLPGLITINADSVAADVCIRLGDVPENLDGEQSGLNWQCHFDRFLLQIPDVVRFLIVEGAEIQVAPLNGAPAEDWVAFLTGTAFGILLHQRAHIVLHASAIAVGDRAVLFCGESGAGKSTIAAALNRRGYAIIADDISALKLDVSGAPLVLPDGRTLKLWEQAIGKLGLDRGDAVRSRLGKFYVDPASVLSEAVPVGALYALREARPPHKPGIERPNIVDATLLLRRNAYRPRLVAEMNQNAAYFAAATRLADTAGIFHLTRALDFAAMDEVLDNLERHWTEIGLLLRPH